MWISWSYWNHSNWLKDTTIYIFFGCLATASQGCSVRRRRPFLPQLVSRVLLDTVYFASHSAYGLFHCETVWLGFTKGMHIRLASDKLRFILTVEAGPTLFLQPNQQIFPWVLTLLLVYRYTVDSSSRHWWWHWWQWPRDVSSVVSRQRCWRHVCCQRI